MSWPASRGRGTGARARLTPKKSANERLLKKPKNPERMKKNDPEEMQDLTNTMGNVKLSQRQFEPLYPGDNCICMRPLKYVSNYFMYLYVPILSCMEFRFFLGGFSREFPGC